MSQLAFGSLFSGIGGIDLGLERAGMKAIWMCEIEPYARKVLAKHWPDIPIYEDVRTIDETVERPDVLCGGFPCQDVSFAGKRAGLNEGTRTGLWIEFARIIRILRPQYVLLENVPGLLSLGFGRVLGDLAEIGYDAEWQVLSAAQFGAWHIRRRVFIIAYPNLSTGQNFIKCYKMGRKYSFQKKRETLSGNGLWGYKPEYQIFPRTFSREYHNKWPVKPGILGMANGFSNRTHRYRATGNAVTPPSPNTLED